MKPRVDLTGVDMIIFDADNTLRRTLLPDRPCPRAPDEWELIAGVREILATLPWRPHGLAFGVASNQDQVGYRLLSESVARQLLYEMVVAAIGRSAQYAYVRLCPHTKEMECCCRKPEPGMLLSLCRDARVAPARTLFVGDADTDRETAHRAGTRFAWADDFFARR